MGVRGSKSSHLGMSVLGWLFRVGAILQFLKTVLRILQSANGCVSFF